MNYTVTNGQILFSWPMSPDHFKTVTTIRLPEIMADLILDALESSSDWEDKFSCNQSYSYRMFVVPKPGDEPYEEFTSYHQDGLGIAVRGDKLCFAGWGASWIDDTVDLAMDADKVLEVIEWIESGDKCPMFKSKEQLATVKAKIKPIDDDLFISEVTSFDSLDWGNGVTFSRTDVTEITTDMTWKIKNYPTSNNDKLTRKKNKKKK